MSENESKRNYQPVVYALLIVVGILLGRSLSPSFKIPFIDSGNRSSSVAKLTETLNHLNSEYVDTINENELVDDLIQSLLQKLDPHSFYIPKEELQQINESLEGGFDGIGVEFNIYQDTIVVVSPISGGPSEQIGIKSGDRIVEIEGEISAGVGITNKDVMKKLRGEGGTKVSVKIARLGAKDLLPFTITRGKIPLFSLDASYMIAPKTGYIKINRFSETTFEEYITAFDKLKKQGIENLILDLRNNPGGYLQAATLISDEFLKEGELIVYTEGKSRPRKTFKASSDGEFEKGKLIVLIDEGSASASEIVAGAVQDWDRGTIIGRRSFGKGLVQDQTVLRDSSALRLTIARYYTPSGRCIQKSYREGSEKYRQELEERFEHGEFIHPDSILQNDSLKHKTLIKGRAVYGGGGIMPDIFVPIDTSFNSAFLAHSLNNTLLNRFIFDYTAKNPQIGKKYKNAAQFRKEYQVSEELYGRFVKQVITETNLKEKDGIVRSAPYIKNAMKALIARSFWQGEGYFSVLNDLDQTIERALIELQKE